MISSTKLENVYSMKTSFIHKIPFESKSTTSSAEKAKSLKQQNLALIEYFTLFQPEHLRKATQKLSPRNLEYKVQSMNSSHQHSEVTTWNIWSRPNVESGEVPFSCSKYFSRCSLQKVLGVFSIPDFHAIHRVNKLRCIRFSKISGLDLKALWSVSYSIRTTVDIHSTGLKPQIDDFIILQNRKESDKKFHHFLWNMCPSWTVPYSQINFILRQKDYLYRRALYRRHSTWAQS